MRLGSLDSLAVRVAALTLGCFVLGALVSGVAVSSEFGAWVTPVESDRTLVRARQVAAELEKTPDTTHDLLRLLRTARLDALMHPDQGPEQSPAHRLFWEVFHEQPTYLQLRLIDIEGRERFRLERPGAGAEGREVPVEQLQDKGQRAYVRDAFATPEDQVFFSRVGLNREHGEITTPPTPVLRVALRARAAGRPVIIIINIDLRPTLGAIRLQPDEAHKLMVFDDRGNFLVHPDRTAEFALDNHHARLAPAELPWLSVPVQARTGAVLVADDPKVAVRSVQLGGGPWVTVLVQGDSLVATATRAAFLTSVLPTGLVSLVAVGLALLASRSLFRSVQQMTEAVRRLSEGRDPGFPVDAPGELAQLGASLAAMGDAVEQRQRLLERMVESTPTATVMVDGAAEIVHVNRATESLFGYLRHELMGQSVNVLLYADDRENHTHSLQEYMSEPSARLMAGRVVHGRRKDGSPIALEVGLSPIEGLDQPQFLASLADVTDRQKRELELRRSNAELERFAYVASHDLQEPLRMVVSFAELLVEHRASDLDPKSKGYLDFISNGSRTMHRMVTQLLDYSRVGAPATEFAAVDTATVVARVLQFLAPRLNEAEGSIEIRGKLPVVWGVHAQVERVFQNVLGNAIKFRSQRPLRISVEAVASSVGQRFTIRDNGVGIAERYHQRIFQIFQRLDRDREGDGLGLAIAQRVVEAHGGRIEVASEEDVGSAFSFTFPDPPGEGIV